MMKRKIRHVLESAGFYPITSVYLIGVAIAFLTANHVIRPVTALLGFSLAVVIAILVAAYKEIRTVHRLVARLERGVVTSETRRNRK